jgi:flagellar biosynthetic protein FlhB
MEEEGPERKHDPSDKALAEAAEQGKGARSADAVAVASLVGAVAALLLGGRFMAEPIQTFAREAITDAARGGPLDHASAVAMLGRAAIAVGTAVILPLAGALLAGTGMGIAQSGGTLATGALEPGLQHLDPSQGWSRLTGGGQPLAELVRGLGKLLALGGVVAWVLSRQAMSLPTLASAGPGALLPGIQALCSDVFVHALPLLLAIAAADYGWSWWTVHDQLMRTDQQLKDDQKESEGDPKVKAARRQRAREIAVGQGLLRLREADVVVTNPTHVAVALRYRKDRDAAPIVLAKGLDLIALSMRHEADRLGIPRVEDRKLARALHARVRVGRAVPPDLYGPVARVLAVLWRRRKRAG